MEALLRSRDVLIVRHATLALFNVLSQSDAGRRTVTSIPGAAARLDALAYSPDTLTAAYATAACERLRQKPETTPRRILATDLTRRRY